MLTVNNRYEVAHAIHNFLFACEGDALFALDLPHYLKLETTRLFSRVLFGTMMYVRVSNVCLCVCVRLQTVFAVLTLCMLILETHTNTQTRIYFLIGSSC